MNFLAMQQELGSRLGAYDETISSDAVALKRWLNMAQNYICGKRLWPFMLASEIVQTVPDYTTGTVATVDGNVDILFSSAVPFSAVDYYIQFSGSTNWYRITTHVASTVIANLDVPAIETSAAATFTIRKLLYTTQTPLTQITDMKQLVTPIRLVSKSPREADVFLPLYYAQGTPYYYIMGTPSSAGTPQWSYISSPSTTLNMMVRGVKNLDDMVDDTDTTVVPQPWHDCIINIAAHYGFTGLDDTRSASELAIGEARINDMARVYLHDPGRHRVMQSTDGPENYGLQWTLPSDFGPSA